MRRALVRLIVAAVASGCGSSSPPAASSPPTDATTPTASASPSASLAPLGYCADFNAGDLTAAMRHVRKGDVLNTDLARQLADIQTWMLADATVATDSKAAAAIRTAASRMGTLANEVGGTSHYANDRIVELEAQAASLTALSAALESAC